MVEAPRRRLGMWFLAGLALLAVGIALIVVAPKASRPAPAPLDARHELPSLHGVRPEPTPPRPPAPTPYTPPSVSPSDAELTSATETIGRITAAVGAMTALLAAIGAFITQAKALVGTVRSR